MIDGVPEPRYPLDDVQDIMKECELHQPMRNISFKVATGTALPCKPGALHHNNPIADGYARVTVDDIVQGCEDLEIDYGTPEGDVRLRDVKRHHSMEKEVHQVSRRGAKATDPEESPKSTLLRWWWSSYTSLTSADAAPSAPPTGKPMPPPPSPPLAGNPTPSPSPPPAKKKNQGVKEGSKVTPS
jgi:hypothetical protein